MNPGDLCVVVDHPDWRMSDDPVMIEVRTIIGKTCVLVSPYMGSDSPHNRMWRPFWKISGLLLPSKYFTANAISEKVLRRIDPPAEFNFLDEVKKLKIGETV